MNQQISKFLAEKKVLSRDIECHSRYAAILSERLRFIS